MAALGELDDELTASTEECVGGLGDGVRLAFLSAERSGIFTGVGRGFDRFGGELEDAVDECKGREGAETDPARSSEFR